MKTQYALVNDQKQVIRTFEKLADLEDFKHEIENRRTGKTTRAIFKALGSEKNVMIVVDNIQQAKYIHFYQLLKVLEGSKIAFTPSQSTLSVEIYGKKISVTTEEKLFNLKADTDKFEIIYDIT